MCIRDRITPDRLIVLIPAHNEAAAVGAIVAQICALWAIVLPLTLQLGAWGAIQTGLRYALRHRYRTVITLDADGQHEPASIGALLQPLITHQADVVIGAFPERASRARRLAWSYFRLLTGIRLNDITSGLRAYNHAAMTVLASREATLLDYQDVGVLLILRRKGLQLSLIHI